MELRRRSSGSALVLALVALALSCTDSEAPPAGTGGAAAAGAGGVSGASSTTGGASGTGGAGKAGGAGTSNGAGTTGASGSAGANAAAGAAGTSGTGGATSGGGSAGRAGAGATGGVGTSGGASSGGASSGGAAGNGGTSGAGTAGSAGDTGQAGSGATDIAPSAGCGMPAGLTSGRASIDVNGTMREYILAVPDDYDAAHPYKLIFGWHPWGGSAEQIERAGYFGLEDVIDGQAILVAPEGQDYQDRGLGWANEGGEDIAFSNAMVDRFAAELCIDENRIFSTGFSFGAMFSFTLACTAGGRMRAIAPMAGNATTSGRCEDGTRSVATMAFIGVEDTLIDGHRQAVDIFVERNGCSEETAPSAPSWCGELSAMYEPCTCVEYQGCNAGYPVIACEYNAGHIFAPNAGGALWDFFSQF